MTQVQAKIEALSKSNPVPSNARIERYAPRLEKLIRFYEEKAPIAPFPQDFMFTGFIHALKYALSTMIRYRQLAQEIQSLAEEASE